MTNLNVPGLGTFADVATYMETVGAAARHTARELARADTAAKNTALIGMAEAIRRDAAKLVAANAEDVADAKRAGHDAAFVDRLTLSAKTIEAMAVGLQEIAALADPVGEITDLRLRPSGIQVGHMRVPLGVIGIVYEARPNVTADAAGLCLKAGNAVLLRGSSSAARSNAAIVAALRSALDGAGLPADAVQLVDASSRDSVKELMRARGLVDVLIPRGGAALIQSVVEESTVPVIETGIGNCHVYVDASADLDSALSILLNAKTQRPSVCNAAESLLVHRAVADAFLARALPALHEAGVSVHGDDAVVRAGAVAGAAVQPATEEDHAAEYLSLDLSASVVDSLDGAIAHIARYGSGHSEAIVTRDLAAAREFTARVDAAAVLVNASTRFTDGEQFGFGAEIGISTQKLHARGPMGLPELTSTKYVVTGSGHVRG